MKLEEYEFIAEKGYFFDYGDRTVSRLSRDILNLIDGFHKDKSIVYRGCNEAKFMMYNSSQRKYLENDLCIIEQDVNEDNNRYRDFVNNLIIEASQWNHESIKKLLSKSGVSENDSIAYLSFMQHYRMPTPFLDFTFNPYIALYFATENTNSKESKKEIDNYCSLYYIDTSASAFVNWNDGFKSFNKDFEDKGIDYTQLSRNSLYIVTPIEQIAILNSANILNQEGLFIYNAHSFLPLEKSFYAFTIRMNKMLQFHPVNNTLLHNKISGCLNFHKSLIPEIRGVLREKGITAEYLFPDFYSVSQKITTTSIEKIKKEALM